MEMITLFSLLVITQPASFCNAITQEFIMVTRFQIALVIVLKTKALHTHS